MHPNRQTPMIQVSRPLDMSLIRAPGPAPGMTTSGTPPTQLVHTPEAPDHQHHMGARSPTSKGCCLGGEDRLLAMCQHRSTAQVKSCIIQCHTCPGA